MTELQSFLTAHGLWAVFLLTLAARIGAPIPASLLLVFAGAMGQAGQLPIWGAAAASVLANVVGDAVWFAGGRVWGYRVLRMVFRFSRPSGSCVHQSHSLIDRWGGFSLVAAKFVPGLSLVAAPLAGAVAMPWLRFIGFGLAAGAAWTTLFLGAGVLFSTDVQLLIDAIEGAGLLAGLPLAGLAAALLTYHWRLRSSRQTLACCAADRPHSTGCSLDAGA